MEKLINEKIIPHIGLFFEKFHTEKFNIVIDNAPGFNPASEFVEGKMINSFGYYYLNHSFSSDYEKNLAKEKLQTTIISLADGNYQTWGILFALIGLHRLQEHNLLDLAGDQIEKYKIKLHWNTFVCEHDFTLINLPTNFYGVAYGIARYRELLGFDQPGFSDKFLEKLMNHIQKFSGDTMYMDETAGQGRFDRYTILIAAEIAYLLHETGLEVPENIRYMLKNSSEICLQMANIQGNGISYGRSIGTYGDTAILEVLSTATMLNLFNPDEQILATAYAERIIKKFKDFWISDKRQSINMWDHGRRTNAYRGKQRILGENLNLCMQIISSYERFKQSNATKSVSDNDYKKILDKLPKARLFTFSKFDGIKALAIIRHGDHVFQLPFVNGADQYFKTAVYMPIPVENRFIEFPADAINYVPLPTLHINKKSYMPISHFDKINMHIENHTVKIDFFTNKLCHMTGDSVVFDDITTFSGSYLFEKNTITLTGEFVPKSDITANILGEFAAFEKNDFRNITVTGFDNITNEKIENKAYETPHGALTYIIKASSKNVKLIKENPFKFKWVWEY